MAGDVKEGALDQKPDPTVYYIHAHLRYSEMVFLVRAAGDPLAWPNLRAKLFRAWTRCCRYRASAP